MSAAAPAPSSASARCGGRGRLVGCSSGDNESARDRGTARAGRVDAPTAGACACMHVQRHRAAYLRRGVCVRLRYKTMAKWPLAVTTPTYCIPERHQRLDTYAWGWMYTCRHALPSHGHVRSSTYVRASFQADRSGACTHRCPVPAYLREGRPSTCVHEWNVASRMHWMIDATRATVDAAAYYVHACIDRCMARGTSYTSTLTLPTTAFAVLTL